MTIEAVREQGKVGSVRWGEQGLYRLRMEGSDPVVEVEKGDGTWGFTVRALPDDAITAYRILKEGLQPPEGFTVEHEGGRISQVWRIRDERRLLIVTQTGDQEHPWHFAGSLSSKELAEITPILAEIAEQESLNDADD